MISEVLIISLFLVSLVATIPGIIAVQPEKPPLANFFWSPEDPQVGELITLNASISYAFGNFKIVSYEWDLNEDGTCDDASGMIVCCCHDVQDIYDVTLTVTDNNGKSGQTTKAIDFRNPPETPAITGEPTITLGEPYTLNIMSNDPDLDNVYYMISWGIDTTEWLGPFQSGETISESYTFELRGDHTIKVKAKDTTEAESDWGAMIVTVSKNKEQIRIPLMELIDIFIKHFNLNIFFQLYL
jgi:PKD repeat protein